MVIKKPLLATVGCLSTSQSKSSVISSGKFNVELYYLNSEKINEFLEAFQKESLRKYL